MAATSKPRIDTPTWIAAHDPLPITAWRDRGYEDCGFDPRSDYVETYWLAVLGPSCILAARRFADWLEASPDGFEVPLDALARTLGLGSGTARSAALTRALSRLVDFGMATVDGATYAIRGRFPPLTPRRVTRLPEYLARRHAEDLARHLAGRTGACATGAQQ